jgi:D-glycero-D-manno-heptose 1,7-bisphosphate phosphatase
MTFKTIFLDRDGVVNIDTNYLYQINDFKFIDNIFDVCCYFQKLNYQIIIITNQSGIARGYFSEKDFQILTEWMIGKFTSHNIKILDIFYCPHSPGSNCDCRKPKPGMFNEAKKKYNINMEKSWMIGDSERDIEAANLAGVRNTILLKAENRIDKINSKATFVINSILQSQEIILE